MLPAYSSGPEWVIQLWLVRRDRQLRVDWQSQSSWLPLLPLGGVPGAYEITSGVVAMPEECPDAPRLLAHQPNTSRECQVLECYVLCTSSLKSYLTHCIILLTELLSNATVIPSSTMLVGHVRLQCRAVWHQSICYFHCNPLTVNYVVFVILTI